MYFKDLCNNLINGCVINAGNNVDCIDINCNHFRRFCFWPPNVFATLMAFLKQTGAYTFIACPPGDFLLDDKFVERAYRLGDEWRKYFPNENKFTDYLEKKESSFGKNSLHQKLKT